MNYQAESNAVEIKRLRDCYAELSKLHQADRRLDEQRIDTLRTRVATLEAALRDIVTRCSGRAGESDFSRWHWQTATDIGEILNTARAALKGE